MKKVVLTGGHLTPALGVIEEIKKDKENWQIYYFGRKYALESAKKESFEFRTLKKKPDIEFISIITGRLQRKFTLNTVKSLLKIPFGFFQAFVKLIKIKPEVIVSFGGYLSVPVIVSGWLLCIPSITHEQTQTIGLGTEINKFFVKKIAVSFPELLKKLPKNKVVLTGNPIESAVFNYRPSKGEYPFSAVLQAKKPVLFITGGKTGSQIINRTALKIKDKLTKDFFVVHQIGLDPKVKVSKEKSYLSIRFIENKKFGWLLRQADIVISRAGANICTYLASLKKKAILIPIPWSSKNEQEKNALWMEKIGLSKKIDQNKLSSNILFNEIEMMNGPEKKVKLPKWWEEANPRNAGGKVWSLAKTVITNAN